MVVKDIPCGTTVYYENKNGRVEKGVYLYPYTGEETTFRIKNCSVVGTLGSTIIKVVPTANISIAEETYLDKLIRAENKRHEETIQELVSLKNDMFKRLTDPSREV